jgi:hypothetical protein
MHRIERFLVYPVLAALCAAVFLRLEAVVADAPPDGAFGVLTVRELKVVDGEGNVVARVASDEDGGVLQVGAHPGKGKGGFLVDTLAGGGRAYARNLDGTEVAYLGAANDTGAGLVYVNAKTGAKTVEVSSNEKGGYSMAFGAEGGKAVAYSGAASDSGNGIAIVWGTNGVRGGEMAYGTKGGYVSTTSAEGKMCGFLGAASDTGVGLVTLHRADGTRTMLLHATEDGSTVRCLKADGSEVLQATADGSGGKVRLTDAVGTVTLPFRK